MSIEKHYTINDLKDILNMSFGKVRLMVKDEPGVLRFSPLKKNGKVSGRTMYRIPESVVQRILRRSANA